MSVSDFGVEFFLSQTIHIKTEAYLNYCVI